MKRTSRVTADITKEAHDILRDACLKFDSSKGKLLEKMIRKFCVEVEAAPVAKTELAVVEKTKVPSKRFTPPTSAEVMDYMYEKGVNSSTEPEKFIDFYESKGWVVGKVKMKSWKAAVRNWLKGYKTITTYSNILQDSSDSDWHLKEDKGF
mgnify:CR=1 FL=1